MPAEISKEEFDDGTLFISLEDNKKNGPARFEDKDGRIRFVMNFLNDKLHGEFIQYYDSGAIMMVMNYTEGKLNGPFTSYYESGVIQMTANYLNGKYEGVLAIYDEFGDKISEVNYLNGQKHGKSLRYHNAGIGISEIAYYKNGLLEGNKITFDTKGAIDSIIPYHLGRPLQYPIKG